MEAIGTLAAGIAHDFNNILSAVIGYSELLQMKLQADAAGNEMVGQILKAGLRARDLVQQILTFSRKSEQELKEIRLDLLVEEAMQLLRASLPANINIERKIESNALIQADPTQIHQVIMNLCTNSWHAMREAGGLDQGRVERSAARCRNRGKTSGCQTRSLSQPGNQRHGTWDEI